MCQIRAMQKKCGVKDLTPVKIHAIAKGDLPAIPAATTAEGTSVFNTITSDVINISVRDSGSLIWVS